MENQDMAQERTNKRNTKAKPPRVGRIYEYVEIRSGKHREVYATWKSYSIINSLRSFGANREEAYAADVWQRHAKPGETKEISPNITMTIREVNKA